MGEATCHELGRRGHKVAVLDLNGEAAQRVCRRAACRRCHRPRPWLPTSATARPSRRPSPKVRTELGPVHYPGHQRRRRGISLRSPTSPAKPGQRLIDVNLTGTFHCCQVAVPDMLEAGWGRIVMISSSSAQRGSPGMAHYAASKGALLSLTRSLAREYGPAGHHGQQHSAVGASRRRCSTRTGRGTPALQRTDGRERPARPPRHRRRHRRRGRVSLLGGGRLHHRSNSWRQRRIGDVMTVLAFEYQPRQGGSHGEMA